MAKKRQRSRQSQAENDFIVKPIKNKQTRMEILKFIAEKSELTVKQVKSIFFLTNQLAKCHLIKNGSGQFSYQKW